MANGGNSDGGAVALAVALPLIAGGGFLAYYLLTKESADAAAAHAQSMQPTFAPIEPYPSGFLDGIFGPGTSEAAEVLGKTVAKEGAKIMSAAAKEVGDAVKTGAKASIAPVVHVLKEGKKAVPYVKPVVAPVSVAYKGGKAIVSKLNPF